MTEHQQARKQGSEELEKESGHRKEASQPQHDKFKAFDGGSSLIQGFLYEPLPDRHAALLADIQSDETRVSLLTQLQQSYGNFYVQRVVSLIQTKEDVAVQHRQRFTSDILAKIFGGGRSGQLQRPEARSEAEGTRRNTEPSKRAEIEAKATFHVLTDNSDIMAVMHPEVAVARKPEMVITEEEAKAYVTWEEWLNTEDGKEYQKMRTKLESQGYRFITKVKSEGGTWEEKTPDDYDDVRRVGWSIGREGVWHWATKKDIVDVCLILLLPPMELAGVERAYVVIRSTVGKHIKELAAKAVGEAAKFYVADEKEFRIAYEKYFGVDADKDPNYPEIAGFADIDTGVVYVCKGRADAKSVIHEALHLYSNPALGDRCGEQVDEGATDYFTQKVCRLNKIPFKAGYPEYLAEVKVMAQLVGDTLLGAAYFEGDVDGLEVGVDSIRGEGTFKYWTQFMKVGAFAETRKVLTPQS